MNMLHIGAWIFGIVFLFALIGVYAVIRSQTLLPANLTATQLGAVFGITLLMSVISAFLSVGRLRRADPADIF